MDASTSPATPDAILSTVSPSKLELWNKCQYQWYRRYVLGERKPPRAAAAFGKGIDAGANTYYREKLVKKEPDEHHTRELWAEHVAQSVAEVQEWPADETPAAMVSEATRLAPAWRKQIATRVEPLMIQREFDLMFQESCPDKPGVPHKHGDAWRMNGVVDLIGTVLSDCGFATEVATIDLKTAGRSWSEKEAVQGMQAPAYVFAVRRGLQLQTSLFQYHVLVRTKEPKVQVLERVVDEAELAGYARRASRARMQIANAIETNIFLPNRTHTLCSQRWCAWWRECQAEFGGIIPV